MKKYKIAICILLILLYIFSLTSCKSRTVNDTNDSKIETLNSEKAQKEDSIKDEFSGNYLISQIEERAADIADKNRENETIYKTNFSYNENTIVISNEYGTDPTIVKYNEEDNTVSVYSNDILTFKVGYDNSGKIISWGTQDLTAQITYPDNNTIFIDEKILGTIDNREIICFDDNKAYLKDDKNEVISEYGICKYGINQQKYEISDSPCKKTVKYSNNGKIESIYDEYSDRTVTINVKYSNNKISYPYQLLPSAMIVGAGEQDVLLQLLCYQRQIKNW